MTPTRRWTLLAGLLTGLAISSGTARAQETWTSQLVGNETVLNSIIDDNDVADCYGDRAYAVGMQIRSDQFIDAMAPLCATLESTTQTSDESYPYLVGGPGGQERTYRCDPGEVVVGFRGKAGDYIDQLATGCRPLSGGEEVRWLSAAGASGGTAFEPVLCPEGMGVDLVRIWAEQVNPYTGSLIGLGWYVSRFEFRCKTLPWVLPLQQVAGQLDYAVEEPPQVVGGQLNVAIKEAPEAEATVPSAPATPEAEAPVEDPVVPESDPEPDPAPAVNEEMSVPAPVDRGELAEPAPTPAVTPTRPAPSPDVVSPRVSAPARPTIPAPEALPPVADAPVPDAPIEDASEAEPDPTAAPLRIELALSPGSVRAGETARLIIRLTEAATTQEQILLSSGAPELAQVPERATIQAGRQEVQMEVTTTGPVERPTPVSIRASFGNGSREPVEIVLQIRPESSGKGRGRPDTDETERSQGRDEQQ